VTVATPEPLVVGSPDLLVPPTGEFWTDDESTKDGPHYTVGEVAKFFFAKGPDWLRWRHDPTPPPGKTKADLSHPDGWFILDGERIEPRRRSTHHRYYTLYDIERMAHALAMNGGIDGATLVKIIRLVKTEAELHGVLATQGQPDADVLLGKVHERLGQQGLDIQTYGESGEVIVRWKRSYDGVLSDERQVVGTSLGDALQQVLRHEDVADEADAKEAADG